MHFSNKVCFIFLIILLVFVTNTNGLRMRGEWKRTGNWDYLMRFCFDKSTDSYGNMTWLFTTNLPNLRLSFYDDQKNSWDSVYKSRDNCTTKNSKSKSTINIGNDVFGYTMFQDTKSPHMWYFSLSDCTQKKNPEILLSDMDVHIFNRFEGKQNQEFSCEEKVIGSISAAFLILLILLVASGYGIKNEEFLKKRALVATMVVYFLLSILLIIAAYVDLDHGSQYYVFEAIPGIFLVILRFIILGFFLIMVVPIIKSEQNSKIKDFYVKFGITSVIWLIYVPLIVFVGMACSPTYREKFVSTLFSIVDFIFLILLIAWFWPSKLSLFKPITVKDLERETEKNENGFYQVVSEKSDSSTSSSSEDTSEDDQL
ncbi:intimal thickness receptor-related [Anaeramoeba flamelloides]|uniref:Intimal thickness receptor-related n=1 Tax=Anaeramoeba flamelloides TaxID=1746091 RepID=A0AAV7ZI85_9EUKA|nr:intimal thickness receptor-related [Anaeramoeba flamelloides]